MIDLTNRTQIALSDKVFNVQGLYDIMEEDEFEEELSKLFKFTEEQLDDTLDQYLKGRGFKGDRIFNEICEPMDIVTTVAIYLVLKSLKEFTDNKDFDGITYKIDELFKIAEKDYMEQSGIKNIKED